MTGADGAPVGQVVADGAVQLLVEEAGAAGGEALQLHVPRDAVAEVGETGGPLTSPGRRRWPPSKSGRSCWRCSRRRP